MGHRRLPPPPPPHNSVFLDGLPSVMTGETHRAAVAASRRIDHQDFSSFMYQDGGMGDGVMQDLALPEGTSEAKVRASVARWERNLPGQKVRNLALYRHTYTPAPGRRVWQHALSVAVARHIAKARPGLAPVEIADIAEDLAD